ncbi:MAG: signal peptidase I [Armatimonadota bacterium]
MLSCYLLPNSYFLLSTMSITERLANLSILTVVALVAALIVVRLVMMRQRFAWAKVIAEIAESLALAMGLVFLLIRPFLAQAFFIPSESMVPTLMVNDHILVNKLVYRFREPKLGDVVVFKSPKSAGHNEADYIKRVVGVPGDHVRLTAGYVLVGNIPYYHDDLRDALFAHGIGSETCRVKLTESGVLANGTRIANSEIAGALDKPSSKVRIVPGMVYLNGKPLKENYTAEDTDRPYPNQLTPRKWVRIDKEGREVVEIPKGRLLVMGDNRNCSDDARRWGLLDRTRVRGNAMFVFYPLGRVQWIH